MFGFFWRVFGWGANPKQPPGPNRVTFTLAVVRKRVF